MLATTSQRRLTQYIAIAHSDISNQNQSSGLRRRLHAVLDGITGKVVPVRIYVEDHNQAFEFSINSGLRRSDCPVGDCHIRIGSAALRFGFSVGFGGESLQVNGRFNNVQPQGWRYLSTIFFLARRLEQGMKIPRFVVSDAIAQSLGLRAKPAHW